MFAGRGEQVPAALQNHGKAAAWNFRPTAKILPTNFCRIRAETIEPLAIFRPVTLKFCRQNGPRFGVQKRPPFWGPKTDPKMEATHSVSI